MVILLMVSQKNELDNCNMKMTATWNHRLRPLGHPANTGNTVIGMLFIIFELSFGK